VDRPSISIAFGFRQPTTRDVLNSMIDYLSDQDRSFRTSIGLDEDLTSSNEAPSLAADAYVQALMEAATFYQTSDNFHAAMAWRRASFIGALPALEPKGGGIAASPSDRVKLASLAICFVSTNKSSAVLSYPGDHLTAPSAFEPAFRFIAETEAFQIQDLPGRITDKSRLRIANKLIEVGVLELCQ
jgi:hypothetical protein